MFFSLSLSPSLAFFYSFFVAFSLKPQNNNKIPDHRCCFTMLIFLSVVVVFLFINIFTSSTKFQTPLIIILSSLTTVQLCWMLSNVSKIKSRTCRRHHILRDIFVVMPFFASFLFITLSLCTRFVLQTHFLSLPSPSLAEKKDKDKYSILLPSSLAHDVHENTIYSTFHLKIKKKNEKKEQCEKMNSFRFVFEDHNCSIHAQNAKLKKIKKKNIKKNEKMKKKKKKQKYIKKS